ncbi:MAG: hypothetical protein ACR2NW_04840 [Thermodesulfobacteriota bacterium]
MFSTILISKSTVNDCKHDDLLYAYSHGAFGAYGGMNDGTCDSRLLIFQIPG